MVKVYLLLRNNKQSGPFSLEELATQKLRPLDLVWIEGRSAAWQYASEIDHLKQYLPSESGSSPDTSSVNHQAYLPKEEKPTASPKIFVSLPGASSGKKENPPAPPAQPKKSEEVLKEPEYTAPPAKPVSAVRPPEFKERLVTNYSSSLEENEEAYTSWIYQKKTKKSGLSTELMGGIAIIVLLLMGTAAYFVKNHVNGDSGKEITATGNRNTEELVSTAPPAESLVTNVSQPDQPLSSDVKPADPKTADPKPADSKPSAQTAGLKQEPAAPGNMAQTNVPVSKTATVGATAKKKTTTPAQKTSLPAGSETPQTEVAITTPTPVTPAPVVKAAETNTAAAEAESKKSKKTFSEKVDGFFNRIVHAKKVEPGAPAAEKTESPASTGNRNATRRDDPAQTRTEAPKKDLSSGLAITTIEPSNNWMQGVHGLKMKVDNRNDVRISNASVEVRYLNEQNTVLEKKTIRLSDIPAGKSITMAIPDHRLADHAEAQLISANN